MRAEKKIMVGSTWKTNMYPMCLLSSRLPKRKAEPDFYKRSSCPFETVLDEWDVEDAECENELEGQSRGDGAPGDVFPVCAQEVCDEEECHYS